MNVRKQKMFRTKEGDQMRTRDILHTAYVTFVGWTLLGTMELDTQRDISIQWHRAAGDLAHVPLICYSVHKQGLLAWLCCQMPTSFSHSKRQRDLLPFDKWVPDSKMDPQPMTLQGRLGTRRSCSFPCPSLP